jgi:hypothetical protein
LVSAALSITGLGSGESLHGIDLRPATGEFCGLGRPSRLYTIDPATGAATQIGSSGLFTLSGSAYGFDFNPTVDRICVVGNNGQDLRRVPLP